MPERTDPARCVLRRFDTLAHVTDTNQQAAAEDAVNYLLSDEAQQYFADTTAEYPVVEGITTTEHDIPPLDQVQGDRIDLNSLASLEETLALLEEVGLV